MAGNGTNPTILSTVVLPMALRCLDGLTKVGYELGSAAHGLSTVVDTRKDEFGSQRTTTSNSRTPCGATSCGVTDFLPRSIVPVSLACVPQVFIRYSLSVHNHT